MDHTCTLIMVAEMMKLLPVTCKLVRNHKLLKIITDLISFYHMHFSPLATDNNKEAMHEALKCKNVPRICEKVKYSQRWGSLLLVTYYLLLQAM